MSFVLTLVLYSLVLGRLCHLLDRSVAVEVGNSTEREWRAHMHMHDKHL